jgi:lipopolysaccharide biosynthesis regulator YciM
MWIVWVYVYTFSDSSKNAITVLSTEWRSQVGAVGFTPQQVEALKEEYNANADSGIATSLLQQFVLQWKYTQAYELLQQVAKKWKQNTISPQLASYLYFNYYQQEKKVRNSNALDEWWADQDTKDIYNTLAWLTNGSASFEKDLAALQPKTPLYLGLISSLKQARQTYTTLKQAPSYYYTWLLAVSLMQAGYLPLAKQLAEQTFSADKKYILSYEVLSQIALAQEDYSKALFYLQKLFVLDPQHAHRTAFYLWMTYYYSKDYDNALLYFNQVREEQYVYDAIRYTILIHYQQKEYKNMMEGFRYLLTEQKFNTNDVALFFDIVFYEPYAKQESEGSSLARDYAFQVVVPYIDACRKTIAPTAPWICKYGEAGRYLSQNRPEKALNDLLYITKTYPHPTVYQALWDYYTRVHDTAKAKVYYMRALVSRSDMNFSSSGSILSPPIYSWNN